MRLSELTCLYSTLPKSLIVTKENYKGLEISLLSHYELDLQDSVSNDINAKPSNAGHAHLEGR